MRRFPPSFQRSKKLKTTNKRNRIIIIKFQLQKESNPIGMRLPLVKKNINKTQLEWMHDEVKIEQSNEKTDDNPPVKFQTITYLKSLSY